MNEGMEKTKKLYDSITDVDVRLIEEAQTCPVKKVRAWTKWVGAAACLCLIAVGVLIAAHLRQTPGAIDPVPPSEGLSERLKAFGFTVKRVENPEQIGFESDRPQMTKAELLNVIGSGTAVRGKIQSCSYAEVSDGDEHWYFVQFSLEIAQNFVGQADGSTVTVISACRFVGSDRAGTDFFVDSALGECREGMEGLFVLRRAEDCGLWNVCGTEVNPKSLGDSLAILKLDADGQNYVYGDTVITPDEIFE